MLFSPEPKENRSDFFDKDEELERLKALSSPIILVLGLRRTGKSSLIKIALNELRLSSIYIDLRKFEEKSYITSKDFLEELEKEVNRIARKYSSLFDAVKNIKGIKILEGEIFFNWKSDRCLKFSSLLEVLNDWADDKVIIVLDEAQELIKLRGYDILPSLAYSFDNLRKVRIILSGSKMGLLYRFLRMNDPESPLYGRALSKIELKPFTKEEAMEFLKRGFDELNIVFHEYERVYNELGGIPGWLTYFGFRYSEVRDLNVAIEETLNYAKNLIIREFENFLKDKVVARERYYAVMRALSNCGSWSKVRRALEVLEGRRISDSEISNYIKKLIEISFIYKKDETYCPTDPLIGKTFM
ncbi:MAG: AAA family ATPase [Thermoprotei archaeon]